MGVCVVMCVREAGMFFYHGMATSGRSELSLFKPFRVAPLLLPLADFKP